MIVLVDDLEIEVTKVTDTKFLVYANGFNECAIDLAEWNECKNFHTEDIEILNEFGEVIFVCSNMTNEEKAANVYYYDEGL